MRTTRTRRALTRAGIALPAAAILVLAAPLAASAHVHVTPDSATPGDYATLQFKVPTEKADASTVKVEVDFPTDHPFTSVSYQPLSGWKAEVVTGTLPTPLKTDDGTITKAVTKVVWTADSTADGIAPGEFQLFTVSAGAVPDTGSVELPAIQTYSDGSVVKWDDPTPASGEEPEDPAPILYITDAAPAEGHHGSQPTASTSDDAGSGSSGSADSTGGTGGTDAGTGLGIGLGAGGLGLGVIALIVGLLAYVRSGRGTARS